MVLAGAFAGPVAGIAHAADLLSVYRDAVTYDAQIGAARASLDAGREKLPQGRAGLLPNVGLGASTIWNELETNLRVNGRCSSAGQYNSNGWTVSLTQPVFRWQNWVAYTQSELAVVKSEAQFRRRQQGTDRTYGAGLLRCSGSARRPGDDTDAEGFDRRTTRIGQAQFRGRYRDDHRQPRSPVALRPHHRPGTRRAE